MSGDLGAIDVEGYTLWMRRTSWLALAIVVVACGTTDDDGSSGPLQGTAPPPARVDASPPDPTVPPIEDVPEALLSSTLFVHALKTERTFTAFSTAGGGFGQAGRSGKYLVDNRGPSPVVHFLNANFKDQYGATPDYALSHYWFARHERGVTEDIPTFIQAVYFEDEKTFNAGTIGTYTSSDGTAPVYAIQCYPGDVIHEEGILALARALRPAIQLPGVRVLFVATGPQQTFARVADQMRAIGVEPVTLDQVLGSVTYMPLNPGEAWGYLRVFPKDQALLRPTDIPVFDELPLDLSVVAGTITKSFQDSSSHVNLKSKERGTPNMVLRNASPTSPELAPFLDKPVHLSVQNTGYVIEASTDAVVASKLRERLDKPLVTLPFVDAPSLVSYDAMCPLLGPSCTEDGGRFGSKATNLGFLANVAVLGRFDQPASRSHAAGYDLVPFGYGVPMKRYRALLAANPVLSAKIDALVAKENEGNLSESERVSLATEVQDLFYVAKVPDADLAEVNAAIVALTKRFPGMDELKFRSSANAEDIAGFDGAGLHDSFSVRLEAVDLPDRSCTILRTAAGGVVTKLEIVPATPQCAIKGVYASLWNPRAIAERSFARIDHATAAMGLSIVPAYDSESDVVANGVVLTNVINGADIHGYTISLQVGNNLVTNPTPGTIAQATLVSFGSGDQPNRYILARRATTTAGSAPQNRPILSDALMGEIADVVKAIEIPYCRNKASYNHGLCDEIFVDSYKATSLDLEFKLLANRRIVIKQVREFHGR